MLVKFVEFDIGEDKVGKPYYRMSVQGEFNSYGKLKKKIIDVNLTRDEYDIYKLKKEGDKLNLDFIIPLPTFPLTLVKKQPRT